MGLKHPLVKKLRIVATFSLITDNITSVYTSGRKCNFKDKVG
jgi:hypothetical protein